MTAISWGAQPGPVPAGYCRGLTGLFREWPPPQCLPVGKNPNGYCPDHGAGVSCLIGVVRSGGDDTRLKEAEVAAALNGVGPAGDAKLPVDGFDMALNGVL